MVDAKIARDRSANKTIPRPMCLVGVKILFDEKSGWVEGICARSGNLGLIFKQVSMIEEIQRSYLRIASSNSDGKHVWHSQSRRLENEILFNTSNILVERFSEIIGFQLSSQIKELGRSVIQIRISRPNSFDINDFRSLLDGSR